MRTRRRRERRHDGQGFIGADQPADGLDDYRHFAAIQEQLSEDAEYLRARLAVSLFSAGLAMLPRLTPQTTFANVLGAQSCFYLALRQLRGAFHLLLFGYYSEFRCLIRSVYESAGLARMMAKEPDKAERWLRKKTWFPDREVRAWLKETGRISDEEHADFGRFYGQLSSWAHPTAVAALHTAVITDEEITFGLVTRPDIQHARTLMAELTVAALFCCFALRNAAVAEGAIDPAWRQDVYEAMADLTGRMHPHLERDWQREQEAFERLVRRTRDVSEMTEELKTNPLSWDNLRADGPPRGSSQ